MFREKAQELDVSLYELDQKALSHDQYDRELDAAIKKIGETSDNFLCESRLAWHFIPDSIKIKYKCDDLVRFERIAEREKTALIDAEMKTRTREHAIRERYSRLYNINDFESDRLFDLVVDTTTITQETNVCLCVDFITTWATYLSEHPVK